jgi:glycosyltransferase involved in cell wall biosynthesis
VRFNNHRLAGLALPISNPLVTLVIPTFNQEKVVAEALAAAFAQDYSPLIIRISDDASTDATFAVIQQACHAYNGSHSVQVTRNEKNLGISKHVSMLNRECEGELLVWAAGDDVSISSRVTKIVRCYLASGRSVHYLCSPVLGMTADGVLQGQYQSPGLDANRSIVLAAYCAFPLSIGASEAWSRTLIERFPAMSEKVWAEDQVFGFRGRLLGPIGVIDEALVRYRSGSGLTTSRSKFSFKKYLMNQLNGIRIYRQRADDAAHIGKFGLAALVNLKVCVLYCLLPVSPVLSLLRRGKYTQRFFKYL